MENELYVIACFRHRNMLGADFLLLWGPNNGGYVTDLHSAGLYNKQEVEKICDQGDIQIPLSLLGITPDELKQPSGDVWKVVFKTDRILEFIKRQKLKNQIKRRLKIKRELAHLP